MTPLHRTLMPDQVAGFLRQGIMAARWSHEMPSEAELCRELHVSRGTLRKGLEQLVRGGWLGAGGRGRHHRIHQQSGLPRVSSGHIVRVLSPYSLQSFGSIQHVTLEAMAERLGSAECRLEYEHRPALFARPSPDGFKQISALPDTAVWVLYFSTASIQRWFADQRIPCLVVGQLHEGVELPRFLPDTPATGRHAAGLFYRRGHRDLIYLIANFTSLNDRVCSETFANEGRQLGCRVRIVTHSRGRSSLTRALKSLLEAPTRPTAFFSTCPEHCLTILCYLRERGLRVPADMSVVSGWDDEFLHFSVPKFSCYRIDGTKMGHKMTAMLLDLIRHGSGKLPKSSILPAFVPGETLGPGPFARKTVLA